MTDDRGDSGVVRMTPDAVAAIVDLCREEPFLFQLAGDRAWYADDSDLISGDQVRRGWRAVRREAAAHVERILGRLPQRERELVEATAQLPRAERTLTRIARPAGFSSASAAGPACRRLDTVRGIIDRGKPYEFRHRAVEAYLTSDWPAIERAAGVSGAAHVRHGAVPGCQPGQRCAPGHNAQVVFLSDDSVGLEARIDVRGR